MKPSLLGVPAVLVLGCGAKSSPSSTPAALVAPAGASVVLHGEGDVDDKPGAERITLYSDGTLHAGAWAGKADATHGDAVFMERQGTVRVEVLSTGVRAIVLGLPTEEQEDPPTRWQVFVASDGALRRILDITPGSYGEVALRMQKGDVLRLELELPAAAEPVVFARGYYIPTPSRR